MAWDRGEELVTAAFGGNMRDINLVAVEWQRQQERSIFTLAGNKHCDFHKSTVII